MPARPYQSKRIDELERIFKEMRSDGPALELLWRELEHRSTHRAGQLQRNVAAARKLSVKARSSRTVDVRDDMQTQLQLAGADLASSQCETRIPGSLPNLRCDRNVSGVDVVRQAEMNDRFGMLDRGELDRLGNIYELLRLKLLDLTKKNRMLNYSISARSKRQLQIVDEVLEEAYSKLVDDDGSFRIVHLDEPEGLPPEEKTEEFVDAFEHAKVSDIDFLTALDNLVASATDDEMAVERLERALRDRVRSQLGLPPRPKRADVNRNEHARSLGIDPSPELQPAGTKKTHSDRFLQTLKYPDELEALMEKISAEARLAEQEAGLSTLFLAFGFLEWYDSDASDKPIYAPLLLLPVKIERQKVRGKHVYEVAAREGAAETNISLQKFLETKFGRDLPDFGDADDGGSVENYLAKVEASIEGLKRWRVRRWLVLGHFAFSRIAIYEDTKPEKWQNHPAAHPLVGSLLSGFEQGADGDGPSFHSPEDYLIDDPEIEKSAPILIQDADASQHSALVDVMRQKNLVIQGPPGTGKSQTITNIIANALAAGKTVLFLAEKQAALDVVKRRLDKSGVGEFCLELHSDRSSPKAVVQSLARRYEIGVGRSARAATAQEDTTWAFARAQISEYLNDLHSEADDGATPFEMIWKSIRGRSVNADLGDFFNDVHMPDDLLGDPRNLWDVRGKLEIFAASAQAFHDSYGHPSASPWSATPPGHLPAYERDQFLAAIQGLRDAAAELAKFMDRHEGLGILSDEDGDAVSAADKIIPEPSSPSKIATIAAIDLDGLQHGLSFQSSYLSAAQAVDDLPSAGDLDAPTLDRARAIVSALPAQGLAELSPVGLRAHAYRTIHRNKGFLDALESMGQAMELLGLGGSAPVHALDAVSAALEVTESADPEHLQWVGAVQIDTSIFRQLFDQWNALSREELELRQAVRGFTEPKWPDAQELDEAGAALRKTGIGRLFSAMRGDVKAAGAMLARLRLPAEPNSVDMLVRISKHVRSVEAFASHRDAGAAIGKAWAGIGTPFVAIDQGIKLREAVEHKLTGLSDGNSVAKAIVGLTVGSISAFAKLSRTADPYRAGRARFDELIDGHRIGHAAEQCTKDLEAFERILGLDPDDRLSSSTLSLSTLAEIDAARTRLSQALIAVDRSPFAVAVRSLAPDNDGVSQTEDAIGYVRSVKLARLPGPILEGLLSADARAWRDRLREIAESYDRVTGQINQSAKRLDEFGVRGMDAFDVRSMIPHLENLLEHREELSEFISLRSSRAELEGAGLVEFLSKTDGLLVPPSRLPAVFDAVASRLRAKAARRLSSSLANRTGNELDAKRKTFAERDRQKILGDRETVRARLLTRQPPNGLRNGSVKTWTQMSLLANEFPKQKRFTPVRGLMGRAGEAVRALKPCFMMSPLSLSKFLPQGRFEFDLLVIDEASQMKPEDALGAMLRARQIVVVGDPKQLPPTSFFERSSDNPATDDEDADEIDDESILERCQKVFGEVRRLKWHYRSRCESLIRFSNDNFYEGSLVTFPAAKPGSFSIDLLRVNGEYQARRNVTEAERVVEEAIEFMRHFSDSDEDSLPTLGIVALNTDQRDLIEETLRRMSGDDELVETYREKAGKKGEPLFVKNLENVQGDERDFIFISMTYGKEAGATVMRQRFGPINSKQGHRRLNVLFSRARIRIGLFASFGSEDVKPTETSKEGVHVLKRYLEYTESEGRAAVQLIGGEADSEFEIEVANRLRVRGHSVDMQVGVSGFKIDLGIRHPDHPEMFLAGIECDGAQYHSSKSARDRDRLREEVLRGLGWNILRVWSTDWFDSPDAQTEKLLKRLEELRTKPMSAFQDYRLGPKYLPAIEVAIAELSETETDDDTDGQALFDSIAEHAISDVQAETDDRADPFEGSGSLTADQAYQALASFREKIIRPSASNWEPHRSILREAMIETFVHQRITDPDDWFTRVPHYQRSGTDPMEKRLYLDRICSVIDRIGASVGQKPSVQSSPSFPAMPRDVKVATSKSPANQTEGVYSVTDFGVAGLRPDHDRFYEASYRQLLRQLIAHVIQTEGPLYGDILAIRIARAHGMERTGSIIQKMVTDAVDPRFPRSREEERDVFWPEGSVTDRPVPFRVSADGSRSHSDTPLAELASLASPYLRVRLSDDQVIEKLAEQFGLQRIRAATRERFESAIAIAKMSTK
ncbi:DUF3320 domain-containing protein [Mesorhizobium sp. M8A.F.Ca.ET.181.01.1.1]|nr:DUF3320 domain-containing protein [Mesorhizobium sp. M8A.F.Ca.ET.182.01.1.1]TGS81711.1 DUF3320 domain-containing protein [Mesorhizobium sp. M8A.F.Ca.ET.181.01.1.1]